MLTATQHQELLEEAHQWIDVLKSYASSIHDLRSQLYKWAAGKTDHDTLLQIEHFHNQFHIQLINIHDLKHSIRHHIKEANLNPQFGHRIPHLRTEEAYKTLLSDLDQLKADFQQFIS